MRQTFRLSGTGGQGLITAGIILAEAALMDGKYAVQSQSYGPEARGGSSKAEVIISDEPIHFGRVTKPGLLLAMAQEAADKYSVDNTDATITITDTLFVGDIKTLKAGRRVDLPITHTAAATCGKPLFANIVALGTILGLTHCVSHESLLKAVLNHVPAGTEEKNTAALAAGVALAESK